MPYSILVKTGTLIRYLFFLLDIYSVVKLRNDKVIKTAIQSTAIVTSLFPSNVRDRLYKEQEEMENQRKHRNLTSYLRDGSVGLSGSHDTAATSKPLADLFTDTTVLVCMMTIFTSNTKVFFSHYFIHHSMSNLTVW